MRREFGRNVPSTSIPASPAPAAVFNGLVGGVRALAAATTGPPHTPSMSRVRPSSSAFAKREAHQAASNSVSSTATSSSDPSAADSPRISRSSMSSVAEVKTDSGKVEGPPEEEVVARESGGTAASALGSKSALVAQQQPSSTLSEKQPSTSSKMLRRRSRDSQVQLADALKPLTGESSHSGSGKRASVGAVSPSIPGINPLSAMGLGRANIGEAAQGWVDSVGSKLAELHRGQS